MSSVRVKKEGGGVEDSGGQEERDMTHYIKDRVELMRQVFSVLRERELLAMAPASLRSLPVDHLQELCLDEVLGISSKRLCSILDGYECPSDTDSDCNDTAHMETLSLDSISSLEEDLQHTSTKHKKREKHHKKHKRRAGGGVGGSSKKGGAGGGAGGSQSTPGMTVLELLELQMRAKAIRAQLQSVRASASDEEDKGGDVEMKQDGGHDDDDIEIKEEKPEVVELITSSEEEPEGDTTVKEEKTPTEESSATSKSQPQGGPRKIKLNRNNKLLISVGGAGGGGDTTAKGDNTPLPTNDLRNLLQRKKNEAGSGGPSGSGPSPPGQQRHYRERAEESPEREERQAEVEVEERVETVKQREKKKKKKRKGSGEKKRKECDEDEILLELSDTEKMFDSEEDGEGGSTGGDSDGSEGVEGGTPHQEVTHTTGEGGDNDTREAVGEAAGEGEAAADPAVEGEAAGGEEVPTTDENPKVQEKKATEEVPDNRGEGEGGQQEEGAVGKSKKKKHKKKDGNKKKTQNNIGDLEISEGAVPDREGGLGSGEEDRRELSDGECTESSEGVEVLEEEGAVVCISEGEGEEVEGDGDSSNIILEISDESSRDSDLCILSKEPSREEILELSRKLEREMDIAEVGGQEGAEGEGEHTWKKRWLESDKVRSVLRTSSLFSAVRRKNMALRRMLREGGGEGGGEEGPADTEADVANNTAEPEGESVDISSVEFYKTLPSGSTEFSTQEEATHAAGNPTKKMAKDAKQLMKMYKKLLKMNREGAEPGGKSGEGKKKKKKSKDKKKKGV